jgi:hypothetical protein
VFHSPLLTPASHQLVPTDPSAEGPLPPDLREILALIK